MPRLSAAKQAELEGFWRAHVDGWRRSDLNQVQARNFKELLDELAQDYSGLKPQIERGVSVAIDG